MKKYKCPCCGYYTLNEKEEDSFEICKVCFWENDSVQKKHALELGANEVSLEKARENYLKFGAISIEYLQYVRPPSEAEKKQSQQ